MNVLNVTGASTLHTLNVTGSSTLYGAQIGNYMYFNNDAGSNPADFATQSFGAIGTNLSGGQAELDFINTGMFFSNLASSAFDWYILTSATTHKLLMRLYNSGSLWINGDLTVTGNVSSANLGTGMEIIYQQITGAGSSCGGTLALTKNTSANTNYMVFPSIYYGYSGSSGTYDATGTSGAVSVPVISLRTDSSFTWSMEKSSGDNVNIYMTFLVVYGVTNSSFPNSY
jgi:hypothetical protein